MAAFQLAKFENETVLIDGNEYKACDFRNCRVVYKGGPGPAFAQCHFSDCEWVFEDAALRTLRFLQAAYHGMGAGGRQLVAQTFENIQRA